MSQLFTAGLITPAPPPAAAGAALLLQPRAPRFHRPVRAVVPPPRLPSLSPVGAFSSGASYLPSSSAADDSGPASTSARPPPRSLLPPGCQAMRPPAVYTPLPFTSSPPPPLRPAALPPPMRVLQLSPVTSPTTAAAAAKREEEGVTYVGMSPNSSGRGGQTKYRRGAPYNIITNLP